MIPLVYFLFAWLVLIALFGVVALITVFMALRYGLSGPMTALSTAIFLGVSVAVLVATTGYLLGVDWTQNVSLIPSAGPSSYSI